MHAWTYPPTKTEPSRKSFPIQKSLGLKQISIRKHLFNRSVSHRPLDWRSPNLGVLSHGAGRNIKFISKYHDFLLLTKHSPGPYYPWV